MNRPGTLTLLAVVLLGGGFVAGALLGDRVIPKRARTQGGVHPSESAAPNTVSSLGKLMPSGGLVSVVGPPGDRIEKFYVKAGQVVVAGKELAQLASRDDRREEVALIDIQVQEAKRQKQAIAAARTAKLAELDEQVKALDVTKGAEAKAQELKISVLRQQYTSASRQKERLDGLDTTKVEVGAQEREQVDLAAAQAKTELEAAEGRSRRRRSRANSDSRRPRRSVRPPRRRWISPRSACRSTR